MSRKPVITQADITAAMSYDPATGHFTWRHRKETGATWNARYAGTKAGFQARRGKNTYWAFSLGNYPLLAHQAAFLYMVGSVPDLIDHIDGDGTNNAWANLRPATKITNGANSVRSKANRSGFKGVCFCAKSGKWRANISYNRKQIPLGRFDTPDAAHRAYVEKANELFGAYARPE